jgi:hypothetical protein
MSKSLKAVGLSLGLVATFAAAPASAEDSDFQYGGYVSNEETRFQGYVWDFLEELGNDCTNWLNVCSDFKDSWINSAYSRSQYYWGTCSQLVGSNNSYVDSVDLAYVAGHGSPSSISMDGTSCNLQNASYGDGDLETIVFHSCKVLQMDSTWRSRWRAESSSQTRPFNGLHHALGFRTNHNNGLGAGAWTSDEFAENLEDGYNVRLGWYNAVEAGYWLSPYSVFIEGDNKQAIFYIRKNGSETMRQLHDTGGAGDVRFGSSEYILDAYYRP